MTIDKFCANLKDAVRSLQVVGEIGRIGRFYDYTKGNNPKIFKANKTFDDWCQEMKKVDKIFEERVEQMRSKQNG
jgi:hypothetical protein